VQALSTENQSLQKHLQKTSLQKHKLESLFKEQLLQEKDKGPQSLQDLQLEVRILQKRIQAMDDANDRVSSAQ